MKNAVFNKPSTTDTKDKIDNSAQTRSVYTEFKQVEKVLKTANAALEENVKSPKVNIDSVVAFLQREIEERKKVEKALSQKNFELHSFINNIPDMAWLKDIKSRFIAANKAFTDATGIDSDTLINKTCEVCFGKDKAQQFREDDLKVMEMKKQVIVEEKILTIQKEEVWLETIKSPIMDKNGKVIGTVGIARDITVRKRTENDLSKAESQLRSRASELMDINVALRVLLKQREQDQKEFEANILSNIKHLIMPYIDKLKKNRVMSDELVYLDIISDNLKEIVSPFSSNLSFKNLDFTPKEQMIAGLIKDGKQDKDIMAILSISLDTIKTHRRNIRKKLGIYNQKVNMRTKLLSCT